MGGPRETIHLQILCQTEPLSPPTSMPLAVNNLPNEETLAGIWKKKKEDVYRVKLVQDGRRSDLPYIQAMR